MIDEAVIRELEKHLCFTCTCPCGEWQDTGPGVARIRHNYAEHVAEAMGLR